MLSAVDMRMLILVCLKTKKNRLINYDIRKIVRVASIEDKIIDNQDNLAILERACNGMPIKL